jgi:hypothetical protein
MTTIKDFLKIGDKVKEKWGRHFYKHVYFCGLEPVIEADFTYASTPKNSITFATTGGEGVHFGILTDHNHPKGPNPVVMTVPMMSKNIILAENLDEFLGIGYYNGWFGLEQLVYDFDDTIAYYSSPDDNLSKEETNFLELVREEFKIVYSPLTTRRLEELGTKYLNALRT